MNDTFEFKRFALLLKKTIFERPMQLIGLTGLILAAALILYSIVVYTVGWQAAQSISFIWGFVGGGCFLSAAVFGYFNTNASGSAYLTLPASTFEKWLSGIIIAGVLFTGVFLLFYRLVDTTFVSAYHNSLDKNSTDYRKMFDAVAVLPYSNDNNVFRQSMALYVNLAGAMLVGSLYFNRVSAIKVALVYCGVIGIIYFLNMALATVFFNHVDQANPFYNVFIKAGTGVGIIELPSTASKTGELSARFIIPAILWLTAFVRLREKEI